MSDDMNLADRTEHLLCTRRTADLPQHFVLPHYGGYSIANLAPTVAGMLGVPWEASTPPLPERLWKDVAQDVKHVVLLILDAVGYRLLKRYLAAESSLFNHLAAEGRLVPLTSIFPSTTVSALTSIWTGQPPLGHGFLGTKLLLPRQGVLANMLKMTPALCGGGRRLEQCGWDPDAFVRAPTLADRLSNAGVGTVAHTRLPFVGSSLTRIFLHGFQELRGYVGLGDLWVNLRQTLTARESGKPLLVGVYWGGADKAGHVYGPAAEYLPATLRHFARSLEEDFLASLPAEAKEGTLLLITADHGQILTPPKHVVRLPEHPQLWDRLLLPPAGESRAAYLYVQPGQKDYVVAYAADHLGHQFHVVDTARALKIGLWGNDHDITPVLRARLGDLILIAKGDSRLTLRSKEDDSVNLCGHHGSLTAEEMLVPLLVARIDRL